MAETSRTITMPQLGETVTEGTITRWLKNVGDVIEKYEAFAEVATDKVNAEIPSPIAGTLLEIFVAEGETVPTGAPIATIGLTVGTEPVPGPPPAQSAPAASLPTNVATSPSEAHNAAQVPAAASIVDQQGPLSPAVRRALREFGLDSQAVEGTGHDGRITLEDVQNAAQKRGAPAEAPTAAPAGVGTVQRLPLSRARKNIAEHMTQATRTIPHAWTMIEVDVSSLVAKRQHEREKSRAEYGFLPTYFQYFSHTVVSTLSRHPLMNSRFAGDAIEISPQVDLSFAIALNGNLVVPVIRNASAMTFAQFAKAMAGVTERARQGHLSIDELGAGTVTVNNTGANGSILSQPIINNGQAAIITMESIVKRAVVVDNDAISIRSMVNICCTIDHRVIDGDVVGAFLRDLKHHLSALS